MGSTTTEFSLNTPDKSATLDGYEKLLRKVIADTVVADPGYHTDR
jgi:hypothetical protein